MNKKIISMILIITCACLLSQENTQKFRISFDFGYFGSSYHTASNGGTFLSGGFGYKMNEDFWLNLTLVKISATGNFEKNQLFLNHQIQYSNTIIAPNFSKDWSLSEKLILGGALGGVLIFETSYEPYFHTDENGGFIGISMESDIDKLDIGLYGELYLKHELGSQISLILNLKSYLPLYLELESFMIGAGIEIKI
ncbi:MAG: hypothetical protein WDA08_05905 [Weeksellaceae bacterium]